MGAGSCIVVWSASGGLIRRFVALLLFVLPELCCVGSHAQQAGSAVQTAPTPPAITEQVTVTATRSPVPIGETAKTVDTLDSEQLHDYPSPVLDDTLRQHAGFELFRRSSSRVTNPTSQGISLRGLGSTAVSRTLVLEDGAPLNDPFGGWIHWNESPASTLNSVTIVTGGGSDLYGSSALGGVIDVTPRGCPRSSTARRSPQPVVRRIDFGPWTCACQTAASAHSPRLCLPRRHLRTGGYVVTDHRSRPGTIDTPAAVHSARRTARSWAVAALPQIVFFWLAICSMRRVATVRPIPRTPRGFGVISAATTLRK